MGSERRTHELTLPEGVTIRTHQSGRQSIQISFTFMGTHCRETLKGRPATKTHLNYASNLVARIRSEIATGDFDYLKHFPNSKGAKKLLGPASTITVAELMDEFIASRKDAWTPSALKAVKSMTETRIKGIGRIKGAGTERSKRTDRGIGKLLVADLTTTQITAWLLSDDMRGLSLKYVRNVISPLRLALFYAVHKGYCSQNPAAANVLNVKLFVPKDRWGRGSVADPFDEGEIRKLLDACEQPAFRNFIRFAFATGLRTGELIGLKWAHVDVANRRVYVQRAVVEDYEKGTKTLAGKRTVELSSEAVAALKDQALISTERRRVFLHPSTELPFKNAAQVYFLWTEVVSRTDVRFRCPRQTRHTFASAHITAGCNLFWLAKQMGHRGIDMINRHYGAFIEANVAYAPSNSSNVGKAAVTTEAQAVV